MSSRLSCLYSSSDNMYTVFVLIVAISVTMCTIMIFRVQYSHYGPVVSPRVSLEFDGIPVDGWSISEHHAKRALADARDYQRTTSRAGDPQVKLKPIREEFLPVFPKQSYTSSSSDDYEAPGELIKISVFAKNATEALTDDTYDGNYCPPLSPRLIGYQNISLVNVDHFTLEDVMLRHQGSPGLAAGGRYAPPHCLSRHRVAIIVPFRHREQHLPAFLHYLHSTLQRQELQYQIFVVEQAGEDAWNKAKLMNAGYVEAKKIGHFDCVVFHDVDLIPEDDRNLYTCPVYPRHMSVAVNELDYKLPYDDLAGGVLAIRNEHFEALNGYSNRFWGWGGEDDDMGIRIKHKLVLTRPPEQVSRYKMIQHDKQFTHLSNETAHKMDTHHKQLLGIALRRLPKDGLNSLHYRAMYIEERPLYTHILVDIGRPEERVKKLLGLA